MGLSTLFARCCQHEVELTAVNQAAAATPMALKLRLVSPVALSTGVSCSKLSAATPSTDQFCLGLAEVRARATISGSNRSKKPAPAISKSRPAAVAVKAVLASHWRFDRHHRLRALLDVDPSGTVFCGGWFRSSKGASRSILPRRASTRRGWLIWQMARERP